MHAESSNLNIMRATAVLAVFVAHFLSANHETQRLWNIGHFGVLLFFVHTSLVLMMSLERQDKTGEHLRWMRFMVRRLFRVYPLSIVAVAFFLFTGIHPTYSRAIHLSRVDELSNFLLTQNLTYSPSVPGVLWSLPYEMQMYLVLPVLYVIARRRENLRWMLVIWVAACLVGREYVLVPHTGRMSILDYAGCFVPGTIAFCLLQNKKRFQFPGWTWMVVLLAAIASFMFAPKGWNVAKWVLCLGVGLAVPFFAEIKLGFLTKPAALIAKYSYGLYLFHVAGLWLIFGKLRPMNPALQFIMAFGLTFAASALVFHFIERPMIHRGTEVAELLRIRYDRRELSTTATSAT